MTKEIKEARKKKGSRKASSILSSEANFHISKDTAFQDKREDLKSEEELVFFGAGRIDDNISQRDRGHTHRDHDERHDVFSETKHTNYSGRRLAFNSLAQEVVQKRISALAQLGIESPRDYFNYLGVSNSDSLFPETTETVTNRFFTKNNTMTNEAIRMDNYEYFLNNTGSFKTNLAKTLLAKIDIDRDLRGTLSDLLNKQGEWAGQPSEVIYGELKNRLRNAGLEHHKEYEVILKLFRKIDEVEEKYNSYKAERQKSALEIISEIEKSTILKVFAQADISDEDTQDKLISQYEVVASFAKQYNFKQEDNESILSYLNKMSDYMADTNVELPEELEDMMEIVLSHDKLSVMKIKAIDEAFGTYAKEHKKFIATHNETISISTEIMDRFGYLSKHFPVAALARWTDEEYLKKNFIESTDTGDSIQMEKIDEAMKDAIGFALGDIPSEKIDEIMGNVKIHLQRNKEKIESVYNPEVDDLNPMRKYIPFESNNYHEVSNNILRDAFYLSVFKSKDNEFYTKHFNKESENKVILSVLNPKLTELRPNVDIVNDIYNAVNLTNKISAGKLSTGSYDALLDSPIMQNNSVLNHDDIKSLKKYGSELGEVAEKIREKDIYGTPEEGELIRAIQESVYLDAANKEVDKLHTSLMKDGSVGKYFFQNNKILKHFEICMEGARNPTTSVETVGSLSKGCFEKMKDQFEQAAGEANQLISNPQSAWLGTNFVGALALFISASSMAEKDRVNALIAEVNHKILEDSSYIENSIDMLQKSARFMNVDVDNHGISGQMVESDFEDKLINEAEREHTIREIIQHSHHTLPANVSLAYGDFLHDAIKEGNEKFHKNRDEKLESILLDTIGKKREELLTLKSDIEDKVLAAYSISNEDKKKISGFESHIETIEEELKETSGDKEHLTTALIDTKSKLKEFKKEVYQKAIVGVDSSTLSLEEGEVSRIESEIKDNEEKIETLRKQNQSILDIDISGRFDFGKHNKIKINTENMSNNEHAKLLLTLGLYRDNINKQILEVHLEESGENKDAKVKALKKEEERISRMIPALHRKLLSNNESIKGVLGGYLFDEYHFELTKETEENILKEGVSKETIKMILNDSKGVIGQHQKDKLLSELRKMQEARKILKQDGRIDLSSGENILSSYLKKFNTDRNHIGKLIHETNNFYASSVSTNDGRSYITCGKGEVGMYLFEMDKSIKEKDDDRRIELEEISSKIASKGQLSYGTREQISTKLSQRDRHLQEGNKEIITSSLKSHRQYNSSSNRNRQNP